MKILIVLLTLGFISSCANKPLYQYGDCVEIYQTSDPFLSPMFKGTIFKLVDHKLYDKKQIYYGATYHKDVRKRNLDGHYWLREEEITPVLCPKDF